MSLTPQIEAARQALEDLTADEAELSRLEGEQAREIEALRASGARDFAGLATLEGKRAALASMLAEQQAHIARARQEVADLEAAKERRDALLGIKATGAEIRAKRTELHTRLLALVDNLERELTRCVQLQDAHRTLRRRLQGQAEAVGVRLARPVGAGLGQSGEEGEAQNEAARALFADLDSVGADVEALRLSPFGGEWGLSNALDVPDFLPWIAPEGRGGLPYGASFRQRVEMLTGELFSTAQRAYAASPESSDGQAGKKGRQA